MTEDIGNIFECSTSPHHLRRGTVCEDVRTEPLCLDIGLFQSASCDPGNRKGAEGGERRYMANEQRTMVSQWPRSL
jgi:hypothetical protein